MLFKITPAAAFAVVATISGLDVVSAHCRLHSPFGDYNTARVGEKLGHWHGLAIKNNGGGQYPGQYDVMTFSDPVVPPCCKSWWHNNWKKMRPHGRQWMSEGCGSSLMLLQDFYVQTGAPPENSHGKVWGQAPKSGAARWNWINYMFFQAPIPYGGHLQVAARTLEQANAGRIAQATPGGWIQMSSFQVNADGAGPFRCRVDESGTGKGFGINWLNVEIQPGPGAGKEKWKSVWPHGNNKNHVLKVRIPFNIKCKAQYGSIKNVCIMRCENFATNGPFGGCIPFQVVYPEPEIIAPPEVKTVTVTVGQPEPTPIEGGDAGIDVNDNTPENSYRKRDIAEDEASEKVKRDDDDASEKVKRDEDDASEKVKRDEDDS
ncbi:hypothetical protein TWF481_006957 [Arthrobotrys musiformis]|uniref:Uncharacterized protein n=1 Tax=Arthrobotrys musiformis TaxID=47236 RepID=A0AAV9WB02_9PEZI